METEAELDAELAEEMEIIGAMLTIANRHKLTTEVVRAFAETIQAGESISDSCRIAISAWIK